MAQREVARPNGAVLRQRRRERTALDIERAALRLIASQGFDAVTVEDIAAAAEISPRTFFRYYATKEDVVLGDRHRRQTAFRETLASRPPEEPLMVAVRHAAIALLDDALNDPELNRLRKRVMEQIPRLQLRVYEHCESELHAAAPLAAQLIG